LAASVTQWLLVANRLVDLAAVDWRRREDAHLLGSGSTKDFFTTHTHTHTQSLSLFHHLSHQSLFVCLSDLIALDCIHTSRYRVSTSVVGYPALPRAAVSWAHRRPELDLTWPALAFCPLPTFSQATFPASSNNSPPPTPPTDKIPALRHPFLSLSSTSLRYRRDYTPSINLGARLRTCGTRPR
jgi:hypothetical protein